MNWNRVSEHWPELKSDIKAEWGLLSEDEIDRVAGRFDRFVGKIQQKYGLAKAEAQRQINAWLSNFDKQE